MSKHTPGPWTVGAENVHGLNVNAPNAGHPAGRVGIACVGMFRNRAEGIANARLIAAAPQMLEALRMFWHAQHADVDQDVYTAAIRAADAAIIAATRETK